MNKNSVGVQRLYRLRLTGCVVGCGRPLNSYRVHPSGVSEDTVGTSCLPAVAMPANRALSSVYPLRGKQARGDGYFGITIRHILILRIIASRWPDATETCLPFPIEQTRAMRNMVASKKYSSQSIGFLIIYLLSHTIHLHFPIIHLHSLIIRLFFPSQSIGFPRRG